MTAPARLPMAPGTGGSVSPQPRSPPTRVTPHPERLLQTLKPAPVAAHIRAGPAPVLRV